MTGPGAPFPPAAADSAPRASAGAAGRGSADPTTQRKPPTTLDKTPQALADETLSRLNDAFERGDVEAAVALFGPDGFWRDLVAFTWNLETVEGHDGVRDLLERQLEAIGPSGFRVDPAEPASGDQDLTEAWIEFETAVGGGHGHVRL